MTGMFSSPKVSTPTVMPVADDEAARKAKEKSIATQQQRSGRQSTIMTADEKLGN